MTASQSTFRLTLASMLLAASVMFTAVPGHAQELAPEMRELFQQMLPGLDSDLKQKVQEALDLQRDYLELTPDQFKRFRDHPANPFEGWHGIDPDSIQGLIRLQFETQPIRSRQPHRFERQSAEMLSQFSGVVAEANVSTLVITDGKAQVALGTVVTNDGHIATKLSEVRKCDKLFCKTNGGQRFTAELVAENASNDLAILKVAAEGLQPVRFAASQPAIGGFIISVNGGPQPLAFGVYSNPPRSLIGKNQAFLGVKPVDHADGIQVTEVTENSAADECGILAGDLLLAINGQPLSNVQSLVNAIRRNVPGDKITIELSRNGESKEVIATLAGRNVGGPTADRFRQMETFGAIQSLRRDEFPLVFQHDTPILPEQCGGPITNLDGEVIGINIARGGRVATYAIPANHLKQLVGEMLRPNVASSDID